MTGDQTIRVLIVDDHLVIREGLLSLLEDFHDLEVVGDAANGAQAVDICRELQPDVVLMDLMMPDMDGVEATKAIRRDCPGVQVLALTSFKEDRLVRGVLEAGAVGFLLKNVNENELADAVRAASRGEVVIDPEANRMLVDAMRHPAPSPNLLTGREREVLLLLVQGYSNGQIGAQLGISAHTVKNHLRSIFGKLKVTTRTAAAHAALKHNLLGEG